MADTLVSIDPFDKRSSVRIIIDKYYTVEFFGKDRECAYRFKIRDASSQGMCILVEKGSPLLKEIQVGDVIKIRYYPSSEPDPPKRPAEVRIAHISGRKGGDCEDKIRVGLCVLKDQSGNSLCKSIKMQRDEK